MTYRQSLIVLLLLRATAAFGVGIELEQGQTIYEAHCRSCHAQSNVMVSSPKTGDVASWKERLARGPEKATDNAVNGVGAMPPMGGATALTRQEIQAAIRFMAAPQD